MRRPFRLTAPHRHHCGSRSSLHRCAEERPKAKTITQLPDPAGIQPSPSERDPADDRMPPPTTSQRRPPPQHPRKAKTAGVDPNG